MKKAIAFSLVGLVMVAGIACGENIAPLATVGVDSVYDHYVGAFITDGIIADGWNSGYKDASGKLSGHHWCYLTWDRDYPISDIQMYMESQWGFQAQTFDLQKLTGTDPDDPAAWTTIDSIAEFGTENGNLYQFTPPSPIVIRGIRFDIIHPTIWDLEGSQEYGSHYMARVWEIIVEGDETAVRIPGDANNDGMVDVGDLGILAGNYGMSEGATWVQGDFNDDGKVDVGDLGILAGNYGYGAASPAAVPEPVSFSLLTTGGLALLRRKR